jgi:hypothetical protein
MAGRVAALDRTAVIANLVGVGFVALRRRRS